MGYLALVAWAMGVAHAEEPEEDVVQVFTWAESAPLQEPAELQLTVSGRGADAGGSVGLEVELGLVRWLQVGVELDGDLAKGCTLCDGEVEASVGLGLLAREGWTLSTEVGVSLAREPELATGLHGMWVRERVHLAGSVQVEVPLLGVDSDEEEPPVAGSVVGGLVLIPVAGVAPRLEVGVDQAGRPLGAAGLTLWPGGGVEIGAAAFGGAGSYGAHVALTLERGPGEDP